MYLSVVRLEMLLSLSEGDWGGGDLEGDKRGQHKCILPRRHDEKKRSSDQEDRHRRPGEAATICSDNGKRIT